MLYALNCSSRDCLFSWERTSEEHTNRIWKSQGGKSEILDMHDEQKREKDSAMSVLKFLN